MIETFQKYKGAGLIIGWLLVALIYLFLKEKKTSRRILFIYMPVGVLVLFFNPLFYRVFSGLIEDLIYFRLLWLIPITAVIGYAAVCVCNSLQGGKRVIFGALAAVMVMISGRLVYTSPLFSKAENPYHVPWEVVEICDAVEVEGREVMAAFPSEFLLYVRQYSATVCMPYGRETLMGVYNELAVLLEQPDIMVEKAAASAKEYGCHYLVISEKKNLLGDPEEFDYEVFGQVGEYLIYKDTTMNFDVY